MKTLKLILITFIALTIAACSNVKNETINNVGDNQEYTYEITSINDNEINGKALDKMSSDNKGIFLYQNEVSFDVQPGDKIAVVWGEYEDEFKSIKKLGDQ